MRDKRVGPKGAANKRLDKVLLWDVKGAPVETAFGNRLPIHGVYDPQWHLLKLDSWFVHRNVRASDTVWLKICFLN